MPNTDIIEGPVFKSILTSTTIADNVQYLVEPCSVYDFFKKHTIREIPDYQRPYSWSTNHIKDLLDDINKIATKDRKSWFLGPLFTTKERQSDVTSQLLDGQQRVTTMQIIFRESSLILKRIQDLNLAEERGLESKIERRLSECRECMVTYNVNDIAEPKFVTEESIKDLFNFYICQFDQIESQEDYIEKEREFEEKAKIEWLHGSKTAKNLLEARKTIKEFLSNNFITTNRINGLKEFEKFINSLLKKCWMIEVPLKTADDSIQIFESLNNRGKSLTLTDKLRYKCLITCDDSATRDKIRKKWKEIYKNLDLCVEKKFFKNDEDFFKVLFNALKAESISNEDEMMKFFEDKFRTQDQGILKFLEIVRTILDFYINVLSSRLHEDNNFIEVFPRNQKTKVKSLLQVLSYAHKISSNSRFLLFKIIIESHKPEANNNINYQIIQEIWCLIRIVFIEETLNIKKSNIIRNSMLKIIKDLEGNWNLLRYFNDRKEADYSIKKNLLNDALQPKDHDESKFIIYLFCYLNEFETLHSASTEQYKYEHLEHLFPSSWTANWRDKEFKSEEINNYIKNEIDKDDFPNINIDNIEIEISQKENLELINAINHKQKESLLQFIGNKWVIHAASNITASNANFINKKDIYQDSNKIKLPKNENSEIGLNQYEDFTYKEIITRSLRIVDGIFGKFYNTWEDI